MSSTTSPGFFNLSPSKSHRPPLLSVIIVSWNVRDLLRNCLQSLVEDDVPAWAEVFVVDSASTDGSAEMVRDEFPWVRLMASETNLGFSRGNNRALHIAEGEYVLLLNPDTIVHRGALGAMLDFAQSHPSVGVVGPKQYSGSGSIQYEGAVDFPTTWNVLCDWTMLSRIFPKSKLFCGRKMGYWSHDDDREVPAVPGSAMLLPSSVIRKVGVLDETMFMTEDMDLCQRVRRAGWSVYYLGSASIVHFGGESLKRDGNPGRQLQIAFQSFWLYLRKHRGKASAAAMAFSMFTWSLFALSAASLLGLVKRRSQSVERWRQMALGLLRWSVANKMRFRHHLADAPRDV
jgi:GT2 family glycosyltransferase